MEWALLLFGIFAFGILPELFDTDDQDDTAMDVGDTGGGDDLLGGGDTGGGDTGDGSTGGEVAQTEDETAGEETDGASDDTLSPIFDTANEDTTQDDSSSEGEQPMEFADFEIGEDILLVTMAADADEVDLDVSPSDDGADGNVFVDNKLVAVLMGVPDATPEDVFLAASRVAA
ncbi:MAG: hypothetical protein V3V25_03565 [Paracoccaceae bacterium]